jgi:type IV pilus assembly protein PilF
MSFMVVQFKKAYTFLFIVVLFSTALLSLPGCASPPDGSPTAATEVELLTASDEPLLRKRARIRLELATGYFEVGQTTVALDELKQAIAIDASYSEAHHLKGLVYMRMNEFKLAEVSFKRALELSPKDANLMQNMGWLLCQQSRFEESERFFTQALATPKYDQRAKTFRTLGLCRVMSGHLVEGVDSLLSSYKLDSSNSVTLFNLASVLFQQSNHLGAQQYIRQLNNSDLANAESFWLGIKVEHRMNNAVGVIQLGNQLSKRFPKAKETNNYQRGAFDE